MTKSFYIYKHTNLINNKVYIGQTCQTPHFRWGGDGQGYKNKNSHFWNAIQRERNRTSKKKKVQCINTGEIFESLRAAANWCGLAGTSGIALVCQGRKQQTAGVHPDNKEKLTWRYVE